MNDLETPPVPSLSDLRLSARQEHLVREIAVHRRHRRRSGLALSSGALARAASPPPPSSSAVPAPLTAFAAWTPSPTTPAPGQVATAESACEAGAAARPPGAPPGLATGGTHVSLVDNRGPSPLVLFGANTSTLGALMCVSGPSINPSSDMSSHMSQSIGGQPALPAAHQITLDRLQAETADNGQAYTIAEGSVGTGVTAAKLTLGDGSQRRHHDRKRSLPCLVARQRSRHPPRP